MDLLTTEHLFVEASETGCVMRSTDWASTPLGPVQDWPQSLRTSVSICLNSAFAILLWWGPDLVMLYNDAYIPVIAKKHPKAMGSQGSAMFPEVWDTIGPMLASVMQQGKGVRADDLLLFLERNGYPEECYFTFSYSPIHDEHGRVAGVFTPVQETTERVIGERRLQTLSRLAGLGTDQKSNAQETATAAIAALNGNPFDLPFVALYLFDEHGRSAQRSACSSNINDDLAPAMVDEDAAWPPISELLATRSTVRSICSFPPEKQPLDPWGTPVTEYVSLLSSAAEASRPRGFMVVGINPHKQPDEAYESFIELMVDNVFGLIAKAEAFDQERKRAEALVEIDKAKTVFFSNISHEFRTPLTLIMSPLEELLQGGVLEPRSRESLEVAKKNSLRLLKLVNNLLDFSRLEAGRVQAHFELLDLAQLTEELASGFRSTVERAGLDLVVDVTSPAMPVYVDRDMWEKIVLNLISNAFKFTFEGAIHVKLADLQDSVQLTVADTGVGIPESKLSLVFERFHRLDSPGRSFEGTGIGLALVQELVKLHGGSITVASREGVGSAFTVTLPSGKAHLPSGQVQTHTLPSTSSRIDAFVSEAMRWVPEISETSEQSLPIGDEIDRPLGAAEAEVQSRKSLVVADDNPDMLQYIARLLKDRYHVRRVRDGRAALDAIRERRPDLLISDVMMPGVDGLQLLSSIREDDALASLPVILLSARAGEEAQIEGLESGADDYLVKPFSAKELLAKVSSTIKIAEVRAGAEEAIRQSASRLREVLEQTTDAVFTLDADWRFTYLNPNAIRLIASGRELLGKNVWEEFPDAADTEFYRQYHLVMKEKRAVQFEEHYPAPLDLWFDVHAYPAGDGIAVFFHDVTARRAAEAALRQSEKLAAVGRLSASISHEINNPLEAITNLVYLLQQETGLSAAGKAFLETAQEELARVSHIATQTLRFYRQSTSPTMTSITAVLDSILGLFDRRLKQASIVVNRQYRTDEALFAYGGELRQCFANLIANASEAIGQDGAMVIRTQMGVEWATGTKGIRVTVADNGSGMSTETTARLFEPFFSTKEITGTGLGLWVTKGIIDKHRGKVHIRSRLTSPHRGTCFTVFLPLDGVSASSGALDPDEAS